MTSPLSGRMLPARRGDVMRRIKLSAAGWLLALGLITIALQMAHGAEEGYLGTWKGHWDGGGGSGSFEMTLMRALDGKLAGGVKVGTDFGGYTAQFTHLEVAGGNLHATYDYPSELPGEVTLNAKLDATRAKGDWVLRAKSGASDPSAAGIDGTFAISKP